MKKIKLSMSSSLPDRAATVSIWLDNVQVENVITVGNSWVKEYELSATSTHILRIKMENDYFTGPEDLNLLIHSVQISDDNGIFPAYEYLSMVEGLNLRTEDQSSLLLATLWGTPNEFTMEIDENNLIIWFDGYQYNIDNP